MFSSIQKIVAGRCDLLASVASLACTSLWRDFMLKMEVLVTV